MNYLIAIVAGFALGSLPAGLLVARAFFGVDIRNEGSGNVGAANVLRTLGRGAGIAVLGLDALKGFIPALVAARLGGSNLALAAAFAAILGHCFSPWLQFKGGKGVATAFGALFALSWQSGLIFTGVWLAVVAASGYASAGSLAAIASSFLTLWFWQGTSGAVYGLAVTALIVWRHRDNLRRLRDGRENRLIGPSASASNPGGSP